jgi:hypothetical protein
VILFKKPYKLKQINGTLNMADTTTEAGKQSKVTKGYLAMLDSSLGCKYGVTVKQTQEGLWTITVKFEGQEEDRAVTTARGDMKIWRNVVGAISFVQENCALAQSVFVEVGGWRLSRLENVT